MFQAGLNLNLVYLDCLANFPSDLDPASRLHPLYIGIQISRQTVRLYLATTVGLLHSGPVILAFTVKPPIKDTQKEDKPPNKGQTKVTRVHTL